MMNQVFIVLSRNVEAAMGLYQAIQPVTKKLGDIFLMCNNTPANTDLPCFTFSNDILYSLHYIPMMKKLVPGSNHFPLLQFYLQHPFYDFYWYIEDDVRFSGDWELFFRSITDEVLLADFISCHIRTYQEEPAWCWWNTLRHAHLYIPFYLRIRSFNPVFRISNAALKYIHQVLINRWSGHHEVLIPTMLYLEGFKIMDFGGNGQFVIPGHENKFYTSNEPTRFGHLNSGTMRASPIEPPFHPIKNKLYHPIKQGDITIT